MAWSDIFYSTMMYMTIFAIFIAGFLTIPSIGGPGGTFSAIDTTGSDYAQMLYNMSQNMSVTGILDLGESQSESQLIQLAYAAINGVDFLITLSVRIVLLFGQFLANMGTALELMIRGFQFLFEILGVGHVFASVAQMIYAALMLGMVISVLRFAIMLWKGVS